MTVKITCGRKSDVKKSSVSVTFRAHPICRTNKEFRETLFVSILYLTGLGFHKISFTLLRRAQCSSRPLS